MNVKRMEGALLNYWVARSAGLRIQLDTPQPGEKHDPESGQWHPETYHPATDWSHGGPVVAAEWYAIEDTLAEWFGSDWNHAKAIIDIPLLWFMRAYVASQFGDEVEDLGDADVSRGPTPVELAQRQLNTLRAMRQTQ